MASGQFSIPLLSTLHLPLTTNPPFRADQLARPGGDCGEGDFVFLVGLLYAGGLEVFQNHPREVRPFAVPGFRLGNAINQLVVFVHSEHAVRRQTFDRKRPGNPDLFLILVGFVVQVFKVGLGRDGRVNFALARDPRRPELLVQRGGLRRPGVRQVSWDFPLGEGVARGCPQ